MLLEARVMGMDASKNLAIVMDPEAAGLAEPPRLLRPDRRQTFLLPVNLDERVCRGEGGRVPVLH